MRIALMASSFLPRVGGAEIVVDQLARRLKARDHRVVVVTFPGLWRGCVGRLPYSVWPLLPWTWTNATQSKWQTGRQSSRWWSYLQARLLQSSGRFDVVNIHMGYPLGMLMAAPLRDAGVPVVITCHGDDVQVLPERNYGWRLNPHLDKEICGALRAASAVTAISPSIRDACLGAGVKHEQLVDIPNGVDVKRIAELPVDRKAIRRRLGWPEDAFVLLTVGRDHPVKNYSAIPGLMARFRNIHPKLVWAVIGAGVTRLRDEVSALGLSDRLCLHEQMQTTGAEGSGEYPPRALIEAYRAADVLVSVSLSEAMPVTVLEGMAAGLPVLATNVRGNRDVANAATGFLLDADFGVAWENAITELVGNETSRAAFVASALDRAREFDWTNVVLRYERLYRSAMNRQLPGN